MPTETTLTDEEQEFVQALAEQLPPVIARKKVNRFLGGVVAPQTHAMPTTRAKARK